MTPRQIMRKIIPETPIEINPEDTKSAFAEIAKQIGTQDSCDGRETFDVYICYREAYDAFYAERLHIYLKSLGIKPFFKNRTPQPEGSDCLEYG